MKKIILTIGIIFLLSSCYSNPEDTKKIEKLEKRITKLESNVKKEFILNKEIESYGGYVKHIGGIGSTIYTKSVWPTDGLTDERFLNKEYISVSFNSPKDVLNLFCQNGYKITKCDTQYEKNNYKIIKINSNEIMCQIGLDDTNPNTTIYLSCEKQ